MANTSKTPGGAQDRVESAASSAAQTAGDVKDKARDMASGAAQKAQDMASNVAQKAQETASQLSQKAQDAVSAAGQKTDEALATVGEKMSTLAGTLRERAPQEGTLGSAASVVADRLQAGGQYLQQHGLEDMTEDVTALVRRYPMQAVLVGLGIGFLLGQTFSPSSRR
jgi:ElaB/YqjD/DUF883 family membrane-anchored ribosome-binding protein